MYKSLYEKVIQKYKLYYLSKKASEQYMCKRNRISRWHLPHLGKLRFSIKNVIHGMSDTDTGISWDQYYRTQTNKIVVLYIINF